MQIVYKQFLHELLIYYTFQRYNNISNNLIRLALQIYLQTHNFLVYSIRTKAAKHATKNSASLAKLC